MRDPLESATLKDELHDRIADWVENQADSDYPTLVMDEEAIASLVSELYSFLTEVQEGETSTFPAGNDDEDEEDGSSQRV